MFKSLLASARRALDWFVDALDHARTYIFGGAALLGVAATGAVVAPAIVLAMTTVVVADGLIGDSLVGSDRSVVLGIVWLAGFAGGLLAGPAIAAGAGAILLLLGVSDVIFTLSAQTMLLIGRGHH